MTQRDKLVLRKWQKMPKKETWSKLKNTVIRKLDWGTFVLGLSLTPSCMQVLHTATLGLSHRLLAADYRGGEVRPLQMSLLYIRMT